MAIGLPPFTSAVLLIAIFFMVKGGRHRAISEMPLLPLRA
jgi:hypothetical protein